MNWLISATLFLSGKAVCAFYLSLSSYAFILSKILWSSMSVVLISFFFLCESNLLRRVISPVSFRE